LTILKSTTVNRQKTVYFPVKIYPSNSDNSAYHVAIRRLWKCCI